MGTPTSQAVSAALKRAGYGRSDTLPGTERRRWDGRKVRGTRCRSEGYEVQKDKDGVIRVRYRHGSGGPVNDAQVRHAQRMLLLYADALLIAGFRSQVDDGVRALTVYGTRSAR